MKRNKCTMCNQPDSRNDTRQLSEPNEPGALRRQQVFTTFYSFCCSLHGNSKGRQLWGMTDRTKSNLCTIMHIFAFSISFIILFITRRFCHYESPYFLGDPPPPNVLNQFNFDFLFVRFSQMNAIRVFSHSLTIILATHEICCHAMVSAA